MIMKEQKDYYQLEKNILHIKNEDDYKGAIRINERQEPWNGKALSQT